MFTTSHTRRHNSGSKVALSLTLLLTLLCCVYQPARAGDREFDPIVKHIKAQYRAKQRRIPFFGLARFAVKMIRPAGVKSIKVAIFEELSGAPAAGDHALALVIGNSLGANWQPLARVRSKGGEQTYVYARDAGSNIKLLVVSISGSEAVVARVKLNSDALAKWLNNPSVMGFSLK